MGLWMKAGLVVTSTGGDRDPTEGGPAAPAGDTAEDLHTLIPRQLNIFYRQSASRKYYGSCAIVFYRDPHFLIRFKRESEGMAKIPNMVLDDPLLHNRRYLGNIRTVAGD
jgi:hypothetical protein